VLLEVCIPRDLQRDGFVMGRPPATVVEALEANLFHQARAFAAGSSQISLHDEQDTLRTESDVPHPYLNRIFVSRFPDSVVDQRIEEVLASYRSRGVPVSWMVGPSCAPVDLGERLLSAGLVQGRDEIGMGLDLGSVAQQVSIPAGMLLGSVADQQGVVQWVEVVRASFGLPERLGSALLEVLSTAIDNPASPWRLCLGLLDGEAVGASRLFLHSQAAGVYHVAALPRARGRGVGLGMTFAAVMEARRLGYPLAILRATPAAQSLYRRLGFREYCRFHWYLSPGGGMR
jgi:GNAT superfamily N-acetyltransferase